MARGSRMASTNLKRPHMVSSRQSQLSFTGLARHKLGMALWQADGQGQERAATGHSMQTPIGTVVTHYYIASRDYVDPTARGGVSGCEPTVGFDRLMAAMRADGWSLDELRIKLPLTTPQDDIEAKDWFYRDDIETRYLYPMGPITLELKAEKIIAFPVTRLILREDYTNARTFADVGLSLISETAQACDISTSASRAARAAAAAFMADLAGRATRLVVDEIKVLPETFSGAGRVHGKFADIPHARIEAV